MAQKILLYGIMVVFAGALCAFYAYRSYVLYKEVREGGEPRGLLVGQLVVFGLIGGVMLYMTLTRTFNVILLSMGLALLLPSAYFLVRLLVDILRRR
jgi:hypothetical protein